MLRISVVHSPPLNLLIQLNLHSSWESIPRQTAMVRFSPTFQTVYHLVSTEFAPWLATRITLLSKCLSLNVELRTIVIISPSVKDPVDTSSDQSTSGSDPATDTSSAADPPSSTSSAADAASSTSSAAATATKAAGGRGGKKGGNGAKGRF